MNNVIEGKAIIKQLKVKLNKIETVFIHKLDTFKWLQFLTSRQERKNAWVKPRLVRF